MKTKTINTRHTLIEKENYKEKKENQNVNKAFPVRI